MAFRGAGSLFTFLVLALLFARGSSLMSTPSRNPTRPDFQTNFIVLFTGSSSNVSTTSATYRNETYVVAYTSGAISTTNTVRAGLGIIRNYFDFAGAAFKWDVSLPSYTSTSMSVHVYANGSNVVTEMAISYLVESSLLFEVLYASITFLNTDDVYTGNNADNNCAISSSNPNKACVKTSTTINYGSGITMDTTQNLKVRLFISGAQVVPSGNNIGWLLTTTSSPGSTSFSVTTVAYQNTQLNYVGFFYILYQVTTVTADVTAVLTEGTAKFGCWLTSSSGSCNSAPDTATVNSAGPTYTPYVYFLGFSSIYCPGNGGNKGNFNLSSTAASGNNYVLTLYFVGNNNNDYKMTFSYVIYQQIGCAGYAVDLYLTLDRKYCNQTCNGGIGQYFDVNNWCQSCDATCYTCVSTSATCTGCYTTVQFRVLDGMTSTCDCNILGYYNNGSLVCPPCHYTCTSCTSSTFSSCTACDLAVNHRLLLGNACPCTTGYYDNALPICASCHYSCWTCSATGSSACLTCNSTVQFRTLSASSCLCNTGYYDNGVSICVACHYSCLTCSGGNTNNKCVTCSSAANRYQTGTTCPCNVGFYDVGPFVMTCSPCHPTCYTCNGPLNTNCLSCNATQNRGFVLNRCDCNSHYYDLASTCYVCDYTCGNCTGGTNTACSACIAGNFRTLSSTSCPCNVGYYDGGVAGCLICSYTCQSCVTSSTNCLACNATNQRTMAGNTCPCNGGYVDTLVSMCSACHYSCLTCSSVLNTGCSTCDANRYLSGAQCLCLTHTYDNGVNSVCGTCSYTCLNCTSQYTTGCTACTSTDLRTLSGSSCPCNARYYDAGLPTCQTCYYTCLTCSSNAMTSCLTCSAGDFRTIVGNQCLCNGHYYENGVAVCAICQATCLNCTAFSTCTACDATTNFRTLSGTTCICMNGYYDTGATACAVCSYTCLTCVTSSTNCLSCNTTAHRTLGSGVCPCNFGYYDSGITMCTLCIYSCDSCSGGLINNCLTCNATALRTMSGTSCVCPAGYYDNGSSEQCQLCYFKCQNCSSYSVCTSCDATLFRSLALGSCGCNAGYFDTGTTMCSPCNSTCVTCNGLLGTNCLTCSAANFRTFSSFMCVCMAGYYEAGSTVCAACSYTCANCTGTSTNCTSCVYSNQRYYLANACPCNAGYFDNGAGMCATCDPKCATCVSTSTNCLSCNASQLTQLSGNLCVCQSTAYLNTTNGVCYACNGYCVTCTTSGNLSCTSCSAALHRTISGATCLCTAGFYEADIPMCGTCHSSCLTCFGGNTAFNCTSCNPGFILFTSTCLPTVSCLNYYFEGQCINTCPNYTYPSANVCMKCTNNCYTCTSATVCLTCQSGYKFQPTNSTCVTACTLLQYQLSGACYSCPNTCQSCLMLSGTIVCTSCNVSYNFYKGACLLNCPVNVTVAQLGVCVPCVWPCLTCSGLTSQQCLLCVPGYTMLGTECLANCPIGMFSSSLSRYCEFCPSNCTTCNQSKTANVSYCTNCTSGLYASNGVCIAQGFFMDTTSSVVQCHPNCQTCTNSSFSSCIQCKPLRGDSNLQAVSGYCDCQKGSIDLGNGICDKSLYKTISTANSFLVSSSASVFGTSLAVGLVTSNMLNLERFMGYNQIISQYYYLNASVPASTDIVFQYLGMSNVGNFLSNYGQNQPLSRRRLLYDNSTQNLESLFLHRHTSYQIQYTCMHIIIINLFVWVLIALFTCLVPCLEKRYVKKPTKCLAKSIKILKYWASLFKYKIAVKVIMLTATEASFNVAVSLKITDFTNLQPGDILSFSLACLLALFYVAVLFRLFVAACSTKELDKKDPYYVLFTDFEHKESCKWYRMIYVPVLILRCLLMQLVIVVLSFLAFYQAIITCAVQLLFLVYTLLCNPFSAPWSICGYLTEAILTAQIAILTVISYVPEEDRLKYTFVLIGLNYAQMAVFGLFCLSAVMKMVYKAIVDCRNQNKVYAEQISEQSHSSDADNQKQIDILSNQEAQPGQLAPADNDSRLQLHDEDVPSIQDIEEPQRIKKRYRVQKRRNVFDEE